MTAGAVEEAYRNEARAMMAAAASNGSAPRQARGPSHLADLTPREQLELALVQMNRSVRGGIFALDAPAEVPALWGDGGQVLWARGESLLIVGPPGVGKTTLAGQLLLARLGLRSEVLGLSVVAEEGKVLYVAADRPSQARRSLARMVAEDDRQTLDERLVVWQGPLPFDLASRPEMLAEIAAYFGAGTVLLDSLKDVALDLTKDEAGSRINQAVQIALAGGIEVAALHHQRKAQAGAGKPRALADVYGSVWITAGAGSVLLLWGDAGDPVVDLSHLKQPAEEVGPWKLIHDHDAGVTRVEDQTDPLAILRAAQKGLSPYLLAISLFSTPEPGRSQVEKARRKLEGFVKRGLAYRPTGNPSGGFHEGRKGGGSALYFAVDDRSEDF